MPLIPDLMAARLIRIALAGLALFSVGSGQSLFVEESDGAEFKGDLIAAIRDAKTIRVVEHSWKGDLSETGPEMVYREETLSEEAKARLLAAVSSMAEEPLVESGRCKEPHHRLEMTNTAGKVSSMEICFLCTNVAWKDSGVAKWPEAFFPLMKSFLEKEGFHPSQDWSAVAAKWKARQPKAGATDSH